MFALLIPLLGPIFGIFGSLLPSIVRIFERKQEIKYEIQLAQLQITAALEQAKVQLDVENIKADVQEGNSVRLHDTAIDGGSFINALRASIRPVITYAFFVLFVCVKVAAAYVMIDTGMDIPTMLDAVWDVETMSLFGVVIGFWFGSRALDKMSNRIGQNKVTVTTTPKKQ